MQLGGPGQSGMHGWGHRAAVRRPRSRGLSQPARAVPLAGREALGPGVPRPAALAPGGAGRDRALQAAAPREGAGSSRGNV